MRLAVPIHRAMVRDLLQVPRPYASGHELGHRPRIPGAVADLLLCMRHSRVMVLRNGAEFQWMWDRGEGLYKMLPA